MFPILCDLCDLLFKKFFLFDLAWERRRPAGKIWNLKVAGETPALPGQSANEISKRAIPPILFLQELTEHTEEGTCSMSNVSKPFSVQRSMFNVQMNVERRTTNVERVDQKTCNLQPVTCNSKLLTASAKTRLAIARDV